MRIKNPAKLKEKGTGYSFLRIWETDSCGDSEDSGDSPSAGYGDFSVKKNLKGLCAVCLHYKSRNSISKEGPYSEKDRTFGDINVKDLAEYVAEHDEVFAGRMEKKKLPEILVDEWVYEVMNDNKKYRRQLGLK